MHIFKNKNCLQLRFNFENSVTWPKSEDLRNFKGEMSRKI
jgi:hypothetical protein